MKTMTVVFAGSVLITGFALNGLATERGADVLELRETGAILPLERILELAREHRSGRVLETELEREQGRYVYEIELLDAGGVVHELELDAASGKLLGIGIEDD